MTEFAPRPGRSADLLVARDGVAGRLRLNRPAAINALTLEMVEAAREQLAEWAGGPDPVEAVVLDGAGERGLCAGGDVRAVREAALVGTEGPVAFWSAEYDLDAEIAEYRARTVSVMDGIVMGGGVGVSAYADLRIVTERSKVAMPETIIGFFPDVGALWLLSRAPGELGTHLALTGTTVTGADAIAAGLADTRVPSGEVPGVIARVAAGEDVRPDVGDTAPESELAAGRDWIDECYAGDDPLEIVRRLAAHPEPAANAAAEAIAARSPLSVAVTLEGLRRAAAMDGLRDVLAQDLRVGTALLKGGDFVEGVRAQLVDKDRAPRWQHTGLDDVSRDEVLAIFAD